MMRTIFLKCEDDSPAYDQRVWEIAVSAEDDFAWTGRCVHHPLFTDPALYPKFAYKEVDPTTPGLVMGRPYQRPA